MPDDTNNRLDQQFKLIQNLTEIASELRTIVKQQTEFNKDLIKEFVDTSIAMCQHMERIETLLENLGDR